MLLKFTKNFDEYGEGNKVFLKKDEPFTVTEQHGAHLLEVTGKVMQKGGVPTFADEPIFEQVEEVKKSVLPEDFPARAILEANKYFTFEQVSVLTVEELKEIKGIGDGLAEQIRNAVHKYAEENSLEVAE